MNSRLLPGCLLTLLACSTASAQPAAAAGKGLDPAVIAAYEEIQGIYGGMVVVRSQAREIQEKPSSSGKVRRLVDDDPPWLPLTTPWQRRDQVRFAGGSKAAQVGLPGFVFDNDLPARAPAVAVPFCLVFRRGLQDDSLRHITHLEQLVSLSLLGTDVTDAGLAHLAGMKNLTSLHLNDHGDRPFAPFGALQRDGPLFGADRPQVIVPDDGFLQSGSGGGQSGAIFQPGGGKQPGGKGKGKGGRKGEPGGFRPGGPGSGNLTEAALKEVGKLTALRRLTLECPSMGADGLKELAGLTELTYLHLSIRNLNEEGFKTIAGFKNLTHLKLSFMAFRPEWLAHLSALKKLTTLELGSDVDDETISTLHKNGLLHVWEFAQGKNGARPRSADDVTALEFSGATIGQSLDRSGLDRSMRELVDLKNLRELSLVNCGITDAGLRDLVWLKNLTTLDVRANNVSGTGIAALVPSLPNLTTLNFDYTRINDDCLRALRVARMFHVLPNVKNKDGGRPTTDDEVASLSLSDTQVTSAGLKELASLKNLTQLRLRRTQVNTGGLKDLAGLTNLQSLDLAECNIAENGVKLLAPLHKLAHLQLPPNAVTNASLKELVKFKGLTALDLHSTHVTPDGLRCLAQADHLQGIELDPSQINDAVVHVLADIGKLHLLDCAWAEDNEIPRTEKDIFLLRLSGTAVSDRALKDLAGCSNLAVLYLDRTSITDQGLKEVAALKRLSSLHLDGTAVSDAGLAELLPLKELSTLYLKNTHVTSAGMKTLAKLENLTEVSLARTSITDSGLKQLASLKLLAQLFVEETSVTDAGVSFLRRALPRCQVSRIVVPTPSGGTSSTSGNSSSNSGFPGSGFGQGGKSKGGIR